MIEVSFSGQLSIEFEEHSTVLQMSVDLNFTIKYKNKDSNNPQHTKMPQ